MGKSKTYLTCLVTAQAALLLLPFDLSLNDDTLHYIIYFVWKNMFSVVFNNKAQTTYMILTESHFEG